MSGGGQGRFAGSGTVGRYWQARCRGFEVLSARGRRLGTVEWLDLDRETAAVSVVHVRRLRGGGTLRLGPESISVVDPWERYVVVTLPRRRLVPAWPSTAARSTARCTARGARAGGATTIRVVRGSRRIVPPAASTARGVGRRVALGAGLVGWLYGTAVFHVARICTKALLAATVIAARACAWAAPRLGRALNRGRRRAAAAVAGRRADGASGHSLRMRLPLR